MKYSCIDTAEFLYPDKDEYESASPALSILSPRGSYACGQMLFTDVPGDTLTVTADGWAPEIYEMVAIPVARNVDITDANRAPHQPEREAPFEVYDCLKPARDGKITVKNGRCAVYFSEKIEKDAPVGLRQASVTANGVTIPVTVTVARAVVPDETLTVVMGYDRHMLEKFHGVTGGAEDFDRMDTRYLQAMRRARQNMLYCPKPDGVQRADGMWEISFDAMETFCAKATALGYRKFLFGLGVRRSWEGSEILVNGLPAMSFACYRYLAALLPALEKFLSDHGWRDAMYVSVADEPNDANATEYRALCGMIRRLAPSLKLLEATSFGPLHGALDVWVPLNSEYDLHRAEFEIYRQNGDEIWYYDCCVPRGGGWINRYMDYPLLATRYHFWGNYAYDLTGYLHWAANCYQPGQDPFLESCPEHHNVDRVCYLPAGDTHLLYPGDGEPWLSVRLENQRASAEEYEMLKALAARDKGKADALCARVFRSFRDVEYSVTAFRAVRNELVESL